MRHFELEEIPIGVRHLSPMAKPRLLLMDEPSLGLAPLVIEKLADVIRGINIEELMANELVRASFLGG